LADLLGQASFSEQFLDRALRVGLEMVGNAAPVRAIG
jgi:hypothetical protein